MIASKIDSSCVPKTQDKYTASDFKNSMKELFPVLLLVTVVLGSIYGGFATPTEAASLGVLGSIFLAIYFKNFSLEILKNALLNSIKTSVMISFIIVGAGFLSQVVGFLGIARAIV